MKIPMDIVVRYNEEEIPQTERTAQFLAMEGFVFANFGRSPSMTHRLLDGRIEKEWKVDWPVPNNFTQTLSTFPPNKIHPKKEDKSLKSRALYIIIITLAIIICGKR